MRTDDFDYDLPPERIAKVPAEPRDAARLLVTGGHGEPARHLRVSDVAGLVGPGDVVVLNATRVIAARVAVRRSSGGVGELLFLEPAVPRLDDVEVDGDGWWEALVRPARKLCVGEVLSAASDPGVRFEVGRDIGGGRRLVRPEPPQPLLPLLDRVGVMPLPPYLGDVELSDPERYQTVYARTPGSAAAPTAGLHLTPDVLTAISDAGAEIVEVELRVGLGTFRPIMTDTVEAHEMHEERYSVDAESWERIREADRVVAVGTTSVRALESAAATGQLEGRTDLFISRPYSWRVVDVLMTNFHQPRSSLLVMIDAFVGPRWRTIYDAALADDYRFLSFGDAMWLERSEPRSSHDPARVSLT